MSLAGRIPVLALTLALWPAIGATQPRSGAASSPVDLAVRSGEAGVEVGVGSMVVAILPTIGGQVSIPTSRRVRVEFAAHTLRWLLEDGEDLGLVTQAQLRVPFRAGPPGSRRSLLLGVTGFATADRLDSAD